MAIKCIIIDDEPLAVEALEALVLKVSDLKLVKTCQDAIEALQYLQKHSVDLMFLDIEMPELSGISFLKSLKKPPRVIFTTAYRQYAVEAFDLDVVDYLVKPISFDRFIRAVNRFFELYHPSRPTQEEVEKKESIVIRADLKNIRIELSDILYINSLKDYVKIITKEKTYITKQTMNRIEELLPENMFLRTHRSYIVSVNNIKTFTSTSVEIAETFVPISRNYRKSVLDFLSSL